MNLLGAGEDVGVSLVGDRDHGHTEELSASSSKITVGTGVVMDSALGKHGVVLNLRLAQRRAVGRDDDKLCLGGSQSLDSGLVTKGRFSRSHDELELGVDGLNGLLRFLSRGHLFKFCV
jgi:hypothetical protein